MDLTDHRVAITGASSGIGAEAAVAYARWGCRVAVSARRPDRLEATAARCRDAGAAEVRADVVDVTDRAAVEAWADGLGAAWDGGLDVLVANAGVGHYGAFLDLPMDAVEQVVQTNVLGAMRTVHAFGPHLEAARGRCVVVSSMIAWVPFPYMSVYQASKAALVGWTRSVRPELRRRGVDLLLLCPGATATEFPKAALKEEGLDYQDLKDAVGKGWSAERVARALVRATARRWPPKERKLTWLGRAGQVVGTLMPNLVARAVAAGMRPRRGGGARLRGEEEAE